MISSNLWHYMCAVTERNAIERPTTHHQSIEETWNTVNEISTRNWCNKNSQRTHNKSNRICFERNATNQLHHGLGACGCNKHTRNHTHTRRTHGTCCERTWMNKFNKTLPAYWPVHVFCPCRLFANIFARNCDASKHPINTREEFVRVNKNWKQCAHCLCVHKLPLSTTSRQCVCETGCERKGMATQNKRKHFFFFCNAKAYATHCMRSLRPSQFFIHFFLVSFFLRLLLRPLSWVSTRNCLSPYQTHNMFSFRFMRSFAREKNEQNKRRQRPRLFSRNSF